MVDWNTFEGLIAYAPLPQEPDWKALPLPEGLVATALIVPADQHSDPFAFAEDAMQRLPNRRVLVLCPGRIFDAVGTRHGRGGGWYDRFFSRVPKEWARMGVLTPDNLSQELLTREAWDEPVDYLSILDGSTVDVRTTKAR